MLIKTLRNFVLSAFMVSCGGLASAQGSDFYPDVYIDWAKYYEDLGYYDAVIEPQSAAQQAANTRRMVLKPSSAALSLAADTYVKEWKMLSPEAATLALKALTDPAKAAAYRAELKAVGLNPDNVAHVVAAYMVSSYNLKETGQTGFADVSPEFTADIVKKVQRELVKYLPATTTDLHLRAALNETRAEYILMSDVIRMSASDAPDDRAYVRSLMLRRAEDYTILRNKYEGYNLK